MREEEKEIALPMLFKQNENDEFVPCDGEVIWEINSQVAQALQAQRKDIVEKIEKRKYPKQVPYETRSEEHTFKLYVNQLIDDLTAEINALSEVKKIIGGEK